MVAYMDAEFNKAEKRGHEGSSLIEIALIICDLDNAKTDNMVDTYHVYVKPSNPDEKIYEKITELTGITQTVIDEQGVPFKQAHFEIVELIRKYEITEIYTYGDYDKPAIRHNQNQCPDIPNKKTLTKRIVDVAPTVKEKLGLMDKISLENLSYIYNCESQVTHNAMDDARTLKEVMENIEKDSEEIQEILTKYKEYEKQRYENRKLLNAVKNIERFGGDIEGYMDLLKKNQSLASFKKFAENNV